MYEIQNMIQRLCPNGVPYADINSIAKVVSPAIKLKSSEYLESGKYPVVDQGKQFISGYTNEEGAFPEKEYVIFGDHTCAVKFVDFSFVQGADGVKVLLPKADDLLPRYLYYCMKNIKMDSDYSRHWSKMKVQKIPVPPTDIQKVCISICDVFEKLVDTIDEELELRKAQYLYAHHKLFSFGNEVTTKSLEECCLLEKGKTPIQKAIPGEYPLVVTTAARKTSCEYQFEKASVCVPLVSSRGHGVASLNQVFYQEGKFALGNILCAVTPKDENQLVAEYLFYYLNYKKDTLIVPLMKGGANVSLTVDSLKGVKVPLPSVEKQIAIIERLKPFETLMDSLEREKSLRLQQYEFYRNKLLSLKEGE